MIDIHGLSVGYGDHLVIADLDLNVRDGEFLTLLGPSGCGKSTLLRAIAGLAPITSGTVSVGERDITRVDPEDRHIGFVFQSYALFPHLNVRDNIAFALKVQHLDRAETSRRIDEVVAMTELDGLTLRFPHELSGGQQQRVAIARVLVTHTRVLLMDEPLSNLDAHLKAHVREEIRRLHDSAGLTTVYVTHDQEEALAISDRVGVMREGQIVQIGAPRQLYSEPETAYVCSFVGSVNRLEDATARVFGWEPRGDRSAFVRPEHLHVHLVAPDPSPTNVTAPATVVDTVFLGPSTRYRVEVAGQVLTAWTPSVSADSAAHPGDAVTVSASEKDVAWLS